MTISSNYTSKEAKNRRRNSYKRNFNFWRENSYSKIFIVHILRKYYFKANSLLQTSACFFIRNSMHLSHFSKILACLFQFERFKMYRRKATLWYLITQYKLKRSKELNYFFPLLCQEIKPLT